MRIIFMGTPHFAVPSLRLLHETGYDIVGVITSTDKMGGRGGKKLIESPVKLYAKSQSLRVLQPKNLKNSDFIAELEALKADLQVVVAFRMLPIIVWDMPPMGTINLHGSLLPKYRGAAPINWAIINGEKETGVTTFLLKHEIDTGDVLSVARLPIGANDTAGDVHDSMMELGAKVVLETVQLLEKGDYTSTPQENTAATKAPKIFSETCQINFNQSSQQVHNFIRGLSPYPAAWTTVDGAKLKILKTTFEVEQHDLTPGTIVFDKKNLSICTNDGFVKIHHLQMQGRKRMDTVSFLNGYKIQELLTKTV